MHTTNILAAFLSVTLATGFYIPSRPLAPSRADTHRGLHSRQVVREVDQVAPFRNADGSSIPGPVYGFPGDLVDPNPPAPESEAPAAPSAAPVDTPIPGSPSPADTSMPVSVPQPDSPVDVVATSPVTPESQPASVEPAPAPVEPIIAAQASAPTPAANFPIVGTDDNGSKVHVEYAFSTRWSTEVIYVTALP